MKNITYFPLINLLRAGAATSVFIYHLIELIPWQTFPRTPQILNLFRVGWIGVDLFFVISGFVISLASIKSYQVNKKKFRWNFIRHRFARIAPLYYVTCIVFLVTLPNLFDFSHAAKHIISHLFFVHNLHHSTHGSINGINWSIATEMQFYFIIIWITPWLSKTNSLKIFGLLVVISWLYRAIIFFLCSHLQASSMTCFIYSTQVLGMLDEFAFGIVLAKLVLNGRLTSQKIIFSYMQKSHMLILVFFLIAIVTAWGAYKILFLGPAFWEIWWKVVFWRTLCSFSFFSMLAIAILLSIIVRNKSFLLIYLKPFLYLGDISYGLYLWQLIIIKNLQKFPISNNFTFFGISTCALLIISASSWHLIEKPTIKYFR